jgi:hypothetical protein
VNGYVGLAFSDALIRYTFDEQVGDTYIVLKRQSFLKHSNSEYTSHLLHPSPMLAPRHPLFLTAVLLGCMAFLSGSFARVLPKVKRDNTTW